MPEDIKQKVEKLASKVEDKLGIDPQEVYSQWEKELALVKELRSDLVEEDQEKRAFLRLRGHWKRELRSPAKFFEGMIIRVAPPFDVLRSMHQSARALFEKNPQKAVAEGWTDAEGNALDNRKTYKTGRENQDYGKKLPPHRYIQNISGIAKSTDMDASVKFTMVLSERTAGKLDIPIFTPVKFRANPSRKQPDDGTLGLNEYSSIKFMPAEIEGFPGPEDVLKQFYEDDFVPVEDLSEWHKANEDDPRRMAIVDGYVDDVDTQANPTTGNSRIVMIDDDGTEEVVLWIPEHLRKYLDFGASSRVIALGRTAQQTFEDEERTMINCEGLYAPPEDKIPLEEAPEGIISSAEDVA